MPTVSPQPDQATPSVRLASLDLVPQADGRLTLAITFSPDASELIRTLANDRAGERGKKPKPRAPRSSPAAAEPRVKRPTRAKPAAAVGLLASLPLLRGLLG